MIGTDNFIDTKHNILHNSLGNQLKVHILGPSAVKVDIVNYNEPLLVDRPRLIAEDIYDLYIRRLKILFPKADRQELVKYLIKKYDMHEITESAKRGIKGKKVFYFRCIYDSGNFNVNERSKFSDWAWVPKLEMNKYLDEDNYYRFIKVMTKS